ncbi:protein kinase [Azoarcus sp. PA01]|nr:protein kinase [Azoarcus sp. PA01]
MNRPSPSQFPPFSGPGIGAELVQRRIEPSHNALQPGTRLAEYELLSVLGEGRFGIVYLAMDHGLQRHVAIQEYFPAAFASRGSGTEVVLRSDRHAQTFTLGLKSFVDEARLLARFDHPALVRVYRFWEANCTAYTVMPYYEGVTLRVARQAMERPPDEAWLRGLLLPLLGAVDLLHGVSCYPRDISPGNVLLLPDGRPVLLDFGAAHPAVGDRDEALTAILDPAFAAIEQYAESTQLRQGPWTNLYALAAVAYYCVSGQSPVASTARVLDDQLEPLFEVVDRLARSFPELNYSVAFVAAIERALNVRPEERPQSVAEFRRALLGGRSVAASIVVPPAVKEAQRHETSPPRPSSRENAPFHVFPSDAEDGNVEDASPGRSEPRSMEAEANLQTALAWETGARLESPPRQAAGASVDDAGDAAWRAVLEAAPRVDAAQLGGSAHSRGDAKAGSWRRALFGGVAVVALAVLGAGGWMMWSDYRDTKGVLDALAHSMERDGRPASLVPPEPPVTVLPEPRAQLPASSVPSGAAAEPQLPLPGTAAPAAAPGEPAAGEEAPLAQAPPEEVPPVSNVVAEETPSPPPPAEAVRKESNNPRVLCGTRTHFSLYRCMKEACERPKYFEHPECKYLRVTDTVRAIP